MPITRHFLGWERPLVEAVRDFIIPTAPHGPVDLVTDLILVPTRHAGRRLTDALALRCAEAGTALLSCQVSTPAAFLNATAARHRVASPLDVTACWMTVLSQTAPDTLRGLFPTPPPDTDREWALRFAATIQDLRYALLEAGLKIDDVLQSHADELVELERWQDLARLETAYLTALEAPGLQDPCSAQLAAMLNPTCDESLRRIILAAVPDPNEPARRVLNQLAGTLQVDILTAAPPSQAAQFDAWGRPLTTAWCEQSITIPAPETHIRLAATPADQAATAVDLLTTHTTPDAQAALGSPDRGLIPYLDLEIQRRGGTAFDPADKYLREHPLFHLVDAWVALATDRTFAALARLLRQPDLLEHLDQQQAGRGATVLRQLDALQNDHLPWDLAMVSHWLQAGSAPQPLQTIVAWIVTLLPTSGERLSQSLRTFLQTALKHRTLTAGHTEDDEFERAARLLDETIHECDVMEQQYHPSLHNAALMLMQRLREGRYHRERGPADIDIDGWLELAWNPAPVLVIAGLNEGAVPAPLTSDSFLTDSLRRTLGLRSDAEALARDSYLLQGMLAARAQTGAVWLISGRVSDSGDPLRPSRLLLQCPDTDLPTRARLLFRDISPRRTRPAATVSLHLDPQPIPATLPTTLSVTAFRDYLVCPFRFYLKRVLRMEHVDDTKRAPDALDFGIMVHDALQCMGENNELRACTDRDRIADFLTDRAAQWVSAHYGHAPPLPIRMALHAAQQRLNAAARVQAGLVAEGWEIIAAEQPFKHEIGGLIVKGKIDRIDRHRSTGAIRVIDYKTTDSASPPDKVHLATQRDDTPTWANIMLAGKAMRWTDLQLPLYAIFGVADAEQPPEPAYFALPRAVSESALAPWTTFDADLAAAALECAERIVAQIRAGQFWPPADRTPYDDFETLFHDGIEGWKELRFTP